MTCRPGVAGGPMSLPPMELPTNEGLWTYHQIRKGVQLAHAGSTPASLFVVTLGCFRVSMPDGVAQGRVLGFAMRGDWLGTEALAG
jgi:CRP-like cAMP-binding protein